MIQIKIDTSNAAFDLSPSGEVARILRGLAATLEQDGLDSLVDHDAPLIDSNGGLVGEAVLFPDE
jgi:hypothetical protein